MSDWPGTPQRWRETTKLFGPADWDTGALASATVIDAGDGSELGAVAEAALAGGADAARRLGEAGVVAVRDAAADVYEVHETLHGWELVANRGTPDLADLAGAAAALAGLLGAERREERR